ncbi:MAG: replication factor C large subunit [Halolamina sp.]
MADWTERYRPTTLSEVRGNDTARDEFEEWAETWDDHGEAVVLHGSPGVGKTSAAHALANDMGWETVELNASDQRTADVIERFAGRAANNATLSGASGADDTGGRQLVVLDEADDIHGTHDRGGSRAITDLLKEAGQPIVLIANEYYEMSRGLRNAARDIEFRDVSARSIVPVLRDICRREDVAYDADALERLAEMNDGDLRGAVRDLQAAAEGRDRITEDDVVTAGRDSSMGVFDFLDTVLKEADAEEALRASYDVDETPDDLVTWVEGNVDKVLDGEELVRAYDALARADVWLGRVRATQNYSYWRYAGDNVAAGVAAAREGTVGGWTRFGRPQFWPSADATADEVVRTVAASTGCSMATARRTVLPFLSALTHHCKPRELTVQMAARYDLDEEAVSFVTGSGETTNKVQSIVEDAQERRESELEAHAGGAFEGEATLGAPGNGEGVDVDASAEDEDEDLPDDDPTEEAPDEEAAEPDDDQSGLSEFM